jgi:WD40 repeat protein
MSAVKCYTRKDFLDVYTFPLATALDFELDGQRAEYASGHPVQWMSWCESLDFSKELGLEGHLASAIFHTALSSDRKLLAISSNSDTILIYDVNTKELRATLEGAGHITFKPTQGPESPGYSLISSICYNSRSAGREKRL